MYFRIIDANLNRATEGLRNIEEYTRFILNNKNLSKKLKNLRHQIAQFFEKDYENLINSRNVVNDVGVDIQNITKETNKSDVLRANIKRTQQALRVLNEYGTLDDKYRYEMYEIEKEIMNLINIEKKTNIKSALLNNKNIYLITSQNDMDDSEFIDRIALILNAGVKLIQYREKNKTAKEMINIAKKLRQLCSMYDALLIINDRIDIAKIVDADGVHLGQDDIDINSARKLLGEDKIIGISTHKPDDAIIAQENNADYIGVGPVFKTPTKPTTTPVGLEYVKWVSQNIKIPFYAIGSIDETNVNEVINAGATRVAAIRALMNASDINKTVSKFNEVLNNANN